MFLCVDGPSRTNRNRSFVIICHPSAVPFVSVQRTLQVYHPVYEVRTHVTCGRLRPPSLPQCISPEPVTAAVEPVVRNEVQLTPYDVSKIKFSIQNETKTYKMYEHLPHLTSKCAIAFCCYSSTVTSEVRAWLRLHHAEGV